jgi:hypothetical protein
MRAGLHLATLPGLHHPSPASTFNCPQSGFSLPRFALLGTIPCVFGTMPSKPFELPPAAAKAFVRDMKAPFRAKEQLKQDEIASRQLHALLVFQRPREKSCGLRT